MVMVVAHPILEASGGPGGLNAPDQALGRQDAERVVDRLQRNGPDLGPDDIRDGIGRDMGMTRDRPKDGQPLGGHLNAALPKELSQIDGHVT
jgi:hypothetical protein